MAAMSWTLYETVRIILFIFYEISSTLCYNCTSFLCIHSLVFAGIQTSGSEVKNCENH